MERVRSGRPATGCAIDAIGVSADRNEDAKNGAMDAGNTERRRDERRESIFRVAGIGGMVARLCTETERCASGTTEVDESGRDAAAGWEASVDACAVR